MPMFVVLEREICFPDLSTAARKPHVVPPGKHEIERVTSPNGTGVPWLVLKGSKIGTDEAQWRVWESPNFGAHRVRIIEEADNPAPTTQENLRL